MSEAVITLHGLTKRFAGMDKPAVAPLDCTIHSGYGSRLVVYPYRLMAPNIPPVTTNVLAIEE